MIDFEDWYEETHGRVVSALTVVAGDRDLAAEATDEAYVRALERWHRVSRLDSAGWVYRTALNVVRRRARRAAQERMLIDANRQSPTAPPADWSVDLWNALLTLPDRERTAVALRYVADLSGEQIAEVMDIKIGTVWSMLDSGRRRLRPALQHDDVDPSEVRHG